MIVRIFFEFFEENQKMSSNLMRTGAVGGIRTRDLILTKDVRYRLRYNSKLAEGEKFELSCPLRDARFSKSAP